MYIEKKDGLFKTFIKVITHIPEPENSIHFRVSTLLTVLTAIMATQEFEGWKMSSWIIIAGTVAGFWVSWIRRKKNNWWIKIIISIFMIISAVDYFKNLSINPYDPREPLAKLLLWLQLLHSYDLPARKDVNYSLLVGLVLISVTATISRENYFLIYILIFTFLATLSLMYNYLSSVKANKEEINLTSWVVKMGFSLTVFILLISLVIFAFIPRKKGITLKALPVSARIKIGELLSGLLHNSAYNIKNYENMDMENFSPQNPGKTWGNFNPDSYFGFTPFLDLNYRGRLSEDIVLRVQSTHWTYHRGMVFDRYNGYGWTNTDTSFEEY